MSLERPLALYAGDGRPETAFGWFLSVQTALGGVISILLVVVAAMTFVVATTIVQRLTDAVTEEEEAAPILEEEDIVEARFVVLGRDFEDELPNRIVPRLS